MSDFVSIADLDAVVDDLAVPVSADDYAKQSDPAPLGPGNYRFVVTKSDLRKDKDGRPVKKDDNYYTFVLQSLKVVEGLDNERGVTLFQDVNEKPMKRRKEDGSEGVGIELFDLLLAYDAEAFPNDYDEARKLFAQYQQENKSFVANIKWTGYDKAYVDAEFAKRGGKDAVSKEDQNAIYKTARKNTRDFVKDGRLVTSIVGPSGQSIEPRPAIGRYYASNDPKLVSGKLKLGPSNSGK